MVLPALEIPNAQLSIVGPGHDMASVGSDRQRLDVALVPAQRERLRLGRDVPNTHHVIPTRGDDRVSRWRPLNLANTIGVPR